MSDELRSRISLLIREPRLRRAAELPVRSPDLAARIPGEVIEERTGKFYRVRRTVTDLRARDLSELAHAHSAPFEPTSSPMHPDLQAFGRAFPSRVLFLDLETCGFSGAPLFLIGTLRLVESQLTVEQLLARDYSEEPAVLSHLLSQLPHHDVIVTFNGKSFDWPFVIDRSITHRLVPVRWGSRTKRRSTAVSSASEESPALPLTHCDLLHLARRYWKRKHELPNCRLQTLELALCGRRRHGDIPGSMIGDAYHRFVRTGDARHVELVLHHNAVDLITLAQLTLQMFREFACDLSAA